MDSMFGDIKKIYGAVAPVIKDVAPAQAQGGLAKLDNVMMKGCLLYTSPSPRD